MGLDHPPTLWGGDAPGSRNQVQFIFSLIFKHAHIPPPDLKLWENTLGFDGGMQRSRALGSQAPSSHPASSVSAGNTGSLHMWPGPCPNAPSSQPWSSWQVTTFTHEPSSATQPP